MRFSDGNFQDLVAQRTREWQIRQRMPEGRPVLAAGMLPVITLSRQLGSGGSEIGQALASELGWDLWDRQLVDEISRSANVRAEVVESLDERSRSEILAIARELLGDRLQETGYRRHLAEVILTVARHGRAVVIGRGANYLLPHALNVRVVAPLAERAGRLAQREGIAEDQARRRCQASDRERADFVRATFGRSIDDPLDYDLVINTAHLSPDGVASVIAVGVRERFSDQ